MEGMEGRKENDVALVTEGLSDEDIPMLTEENHEEWKDEMENFLKKKGLWDYVTGEKREPENTFSEEYEDWLQKKKEIISLLRRKCEYEKLQNLEKQDIMVHIWSQLTNMHKTKRAGETDESGDDVDDIPTLREENYKTWKDSMENFLKEKGFWDYVIGAKYHPEDTSSKEYEDWQKKKEEIISVFKEKCGARALPYIDELDNVTHIWSQLVIMFEFTYPTNTTLGNNQVTMPRSTAYTWCLPLYKAIVDGNWKTMSQLLSKNEGAVRARLTTRGELPIHVAVQEGKVKIAKELIKMMFVDDLSREEKNDRIPIHISASDGNEEIVKAMVEKDKKLALLESEFYGGKIPVNIAAMAGNKSVVNYLYRITICQDVGTQMQENDDKLEKTRASILICLIRGEFYGLALDLVQKYPHLVLIEDDEWIALEILAEKKTAFKSSLPRISVGNIAYYFIYSLPGCKDIYEEKLKHFQALKLLKEIWGKMLVQVDEVERVEEGLLSAMFYATKNGTVEFIQECIKTCPQLLTLSSDYHDDETIFHCAIKHRQGKIFGLIHHLGPMKNDLALMNDDESGDFMSHLAAKKPANIERLNQVPGAALQMQRELLWSKEVEYVMNSNYHWFEDKKKRTPKALFTVEHKDLLEEGAKWMKDTSTQCMVVATLISTIMFAAVFTIPGIDSGRILTGGGEASKYVQDKFSTAFVISNVLALCSSVASLLMFLAIITSRFAEEDFLSTLPRMLVLGLSFLFISIVGMMISFVAAVLFMLPYEVRLWAFYPIVVLASIPISIYALVELPLFVQLVFNTSSSDVFGKRTK